LSTNASTSTRLGLGIRANASLSGTAQAPAGTVTFKAFGPGDLTCYSPIFTSTVAVAANLATSAWFIPSHAGTYRWQSTYSGDATYAANGPTVCADPAAAVDVAKANTYLTAAAGPPTATGIHGTATLANGTLPTGNLTFMLTGPDDMFCSGPPAFTSTVAVNGVGSYDSGTFAPTRAGKYTWRAIYSGDVDNLGTSITPCQNDNAAQTVTTVAPASGSGGATGAALSVFRPDNGVWYVQDSVGGPVMQTSWGQAGDIPVPGDYNGDGKTELAVFRPSSGLWLIQGMPAVSYGWAGSVPVPGDYNGDGKTDIAVFWPPAGIWFVRDMPAVSFGVFTDIPAPGDYNGDGKTDIAVYRPSTGSWFVRDMFSATIGGPGDVPVPADYNGDGKTDIGIWRPSTGRWLVPGILDKVLGQTGDVPQPGDYDGDGRADLTVFRPSSGTFYLNQSTAGVATSVVGVVGEVATTVVGVVSSLGGLLGL